MQEPEDDSYEMHSPSQGEPGHRPPLETTQVVSSDLSFDWRKIPPKDRYTSVIVPDHLSVEPSSEYHCPIYMRRVAVFCNGIQMPRVIEYDIQGGWVRQHRIPSGKVRVSKHGSVIGFKREGRIEVKLIGELKGRVVAYGKGEQIECVLVRYSDGSEYPCGRVDINDLTYIQPVSVSDATPAVNPIGDSRVGGFVDCKDPTCPAEGGSGPGCDDCTGPLPPT